MIIDKSKISGTRFMFTVACFLQSSALLTSFLSNITKNESWMPVVIGAILFIPVIFIYKSLMLRFPDKTLIGMLEEVFGKVIGKILGISYAWFFLTLSALNVNDLGIFAKITVMRETPHMILSLTCIAVVVCAVRHGAKVVTRYSALFTIIDIIIVIMSIIFLFSIIDFKNFLPIFNQQPIKYIQSTHLITTVPIGEIVVLLMLTPCVNFSKKNITKYWLIGMLIGMLTLIAVLLRDIAVLGNLLHLFSLPGLVSMRLVSLGEALNRVEILFAGALMMILFFKISVLCYASTIAISELFKTKKFKNLALIVGLLVIFYVPMLYPNEVAHMIYAQSVTPFLWSFFEMIIPSLMILTAVIKGRTEKTLEDLSEKKEVEHAWDG